MADLGTFRGEVRRWSGAEHARAAEQTLGDGGYHRSRFAELCGC